MRAYLTTAEAAAAARQHPVTIRKALEGGTLHGTQPVPGGRWKVREDCLEAYVEGRPCEHRQAARPNVTPIRARAS